MNNEKKLLKDPNHMLQLLKESGIIQPDMTLVELEESGKKLAENLGNAELNCFVLPGGMVICEF
ncbi:hypothetical protein [Bacillus cereus]|uniref:hypothetical protein n=1 Tax=Bacillus cereus group TaxID=86661 RepID=UPI00099565B2|nr:hypothetical protein [Bacillus cereus]OPA26080.1 hypothetical protein BHL53_06565 [Bacillus cereus]